MRFESNDSRARTRHGGATAGLAMMVLVSALGVAGCSDLLEVELPGQVAAEDLNDPRLARTLVVSAQADFECGFREFIRWTGTWTSEIQDLGGGRPQSLLQTRANSYNFYADHCEGTEPNYAPLQTPRQAGKFAYELISTFDAADVAGDKNELLATSKLYEAYSIELLSETYCRVTFDNGPLLTQREGLQLAETAFGSVLDHASQVTDATRAAELRNAALVGRARTRLMLGDNAGVIGDASQVPIDFVFYATYSENPSRRENWIYESFNIGTSTSVGVVLRPLQFLDGIPDPRIPIVLTERVSPQAANIRIWEQRKFLSRSASVPIGTGREAKIMIAEADLGQAVGIINELRSTPSTIVPLPDGWPDFPVFGGGTDAEVLAQVKEERRRELFLQGTSVGDLLRWGDPFPSGNDERGRAYTLTSTCMHVPEFEEVGNPNITSTPSREPSL